MSSAKDNLNYSTPRRGWGNDCQIPCGWKARCSCTKCSEYSKPRGVPSNQWSNHNGHGKECWGPLILEWWLTVLVRGWFHIKARRKTWPYFFFNFWPKKSKGFDILVVKIFFKQNFGYFWPLLEFFKDFFNFSRF